MPSLSDNTFMDAYKTNTELAKFLSRPVLIQEINWSEGANVDLTFEPWDLFFNTPSIRRKLDNYMFLSCTLKLKFMVNASPFYYGFANFAYEPLPLYGGGLLIESGNSEAAPIALSQRPHVFIYPQDNKGGEMTLPFFYNQDWLRVGIRSKFQEMGKMRFLTYTPLLNANSVAGTGITIQVLCYAEDVKVCGPTYELALQAGDEYEDEGIISKPASAISKAAGALSAIPPIAPFMRATEFVAGAVASVAAFFGFTNVPVIEDVKPFKDMPFHSMASTEIGQPVDKLTFDPKNELTVDPRVTGLSGVDEMGISYLLQKESYITQFPWTSGTAPGTTIFMMNITPELYQQVDTGGNIRAVNSTPMCHISRMFQYWKGDIVVKLRFICSKYHRGRVVVVWDPYTYEFTQNPFEFMTTNYNRVIDIAEEPEVEIRIPYQQSTSWLQFENTFNRTHFSSNPASVDGFNIFNINGQLGVYVLTAQTSPVASADIQVMVSVRGADNLEFAGPKELPADYSQFVAQSGYDEEIEEKPITGEVPKNDLKINSVYMGEAIASLRQILRRTCYYRTLSYMGPENVTYSLFESIIGRMPYMPGYDPLGVQQAEGILTIGSNFNYNWCRLTPISYLANMYVGYRGSVNWYFNSDNDDTSRSLKAQRLYVLRLNNDSAIQTINNVTDVANARQLSVQNNQGGFSGLSLLNQETQTGLCVQVPMYSQFRMLNTNPFYMTGPGNLSQDNTEQDSILIQSSHHPKIVGAKDGMLDMYCSIGTDFGFIFFLNIPTFIKYPFTPPPPV